MLSIFESLNLPVNMLKSPLTMLFKIKTKISTHPRPGEIDF